MGNKTKIKDVGNTPIFIDLETGRFSAEIAGKVVNRRSLSDIEKELRKTVSPVEAYTFNGYHSSPNSARRVEIVGFEKGKVRLSNGALERTRYFFLLDLEQLTKIEEFVSRQESLEEEWREFIGTLTRLDEDNIEEARKSQSQEPEK